MWVAVTLLLVLAIAVCVILLMMKEVSKAPEVRRQWPQWSQRCSHGQKLGVHCIGCHQSNDCLHYRDG